MVAAGQRINIPLISNPSYLTLYIPDLHVCICKAKIVNGKNLMIGQN